MNIINKTLNFKCFWEPLFDKMGLVNPYFTSKFCYKPQNEIYYVIRLFKSELSKGDDIYVELQDADGNFFEDDYRILYKLKYESDWETKYTKVNGRDSYIIKKTQLELINKSHKSSLFPVLNTENLDPLEIDELKSKYLKEVLEEEPIEKITIRDLYCIIQNKPNSNKEWLNKLIKNEE